MTASLSEYHVLELLGKGTFGKVSKIRRRSDNAILVWKEMMYGTMTEKEKQLIVQEVNLLQKLNHPNIIRYHDRIVDKSTATLYVIMEFAEGGDLARVIRKCKREATYVAEDVIWKVLAQMTMALAECHHRKEGVILHRDVKPGNVFLDRHNNVKLGDFGLARVLGSESAFAQTYVGTPYYMSPEQVNGRLYNEKCDVWALGCLIYELATLVPPFEATTRPLLEQRIRQGFRGRLPSRYSPDLLNAITFMLASDSARRASVDDLARLPQISARINRVERRISQALAAPVPMPASAPAPIPAPAPSATAVAPQQPVQPIHRSRSDVTPEAVLAIREQEVERREKEVAKREAALEHRERDLRALEVRLRHLESAIGPVPVLPPPPITQGRGKENHRVISVPSIQAVTIIPKPV